MNAVNPLPVPSTVFERMSALTGLRMASHADALRIVEAGLSAFTYKRVARTLKFPPALVASETTIRRRLSSNARLTEAESERVLRLVRVYAEALGLFGDEAATLRWLHAPAAYLDAQAPITPLELAAKDAGARLLEAHIRRTAHGIF